MKTLYKIILSSLLVLAFACSDDETTNNTQTGTGSLNIMIDNVMKTKADESTDLILNRPYITENEDTITFSKFQYFISNIYLISTTGDSVSIPSSYHLIRSSASSATTAINLTAVPAGAYTGVAYSLGIDTQANLDETIIEGDLDPNSDMSWNWQIGYKFLNMEGNYSASNEGSTGDFIFHIGLNNNYRKLHLDLPKDLVITNDGTAMLHAMANINKLFGAVNKIDVAVSNKIKTGPKEEVAAFVENYEQGFIMAHHIEN